MSMVEKLYVLAGTAHEVSVFTGELEIPLNNLRYIAKADHLRGLRNPRYVIIGTFWQRSDARDIWQALQYCITDHEPLLPARWVSQTVMAPQPQPTCGIDEPEPPEEAPEPVKHKGFKKIRNV